MTPVSTGGDSSEERELEKSVKRTLGIVENSENLIEELAVCEQMQTSATNLGENDSPGCALWNKIAWITKKIGPEVS